MTYTANDWYSAIILNVLKHGPSIVTRNASVKRAFANSIQFWSTPLVSTRKTAWKNCLREWEWFMSGSCDITTLHESVRPWWYPWAKKAGMVCYNYSLQFRSFFGWGGRSVDQIALLINGIKNHPYSRRNVITTWNTRDMNAPECVITNCHGTVIQCFVNPDDSLHLVTYQRSADVICGLPHNWLQYWAFLLWLAHRTGRKVGSFIWMGGDIHIYDEHAELAQRILDNTEEANKRNQPNLVYKPTSEEFKADDFTLDGEYSPVLLDKAKMIV